MSLSSLAVVGFALVILFLGGMALLRLILRGDFARTPRAERVGLAWVLGCSLVSLAIFLGGFLAKGAGLLAIVTALVLALFWWSRQSAVPTTENESWSRVALGLGFLIVAQFVFVAWFAPQIALGWDGIVLWEAKARLAFASGGALPVSYFADPPFAWAHARYPLFLPYLQDWLYLWLGRPDQAWVRILGPITYGAVACMLFGAARRMGVHQVPALSAVVAFFFVPYCFTGQWGVLSGYADFPLGMVYLAAVSRLPLSHHQVSNRELALFAILAGITPWVKQEGLILWLVLMAVAGLLLLTQKRWKAMLGVAIPGVIIGGGFKLFLAAVGTPADPYYRTPTLENLRAFSDRILPVFASIGRDLTLLESWSLLWIGAGLALLVFAFRREWRLAMGFGLALVMPLFLFAWPFVLSAFEPYTLHMELALPRLVFQLAPAAMLVIALALPFRRGRRDDPPQGPIA